MGELNRWIGDRMRVGITGVFGVSGENDNGRRVVEFCAESEVCVGNTYFKHKSYISALGRLGTTTELR